VISAYDRAVGPLGLAVRGVPHASQNVACGRFSCWHRGQCIPSVSRVRIVRGLPGTPRHGTRAATGARLPGRPVGHGRPDPTLTRPRAPDGRFWGVVRPGACGRPHRRLRRVETHVYVGPSPRAIVISTPSPGGPPVSGETRSFTIGIVERRRRVASGAAQLPTASPASVPPPRRLRPRPGALAPAWRRSRTSARHTGPAPPRGGVVCGPGPHLAHVGHERLHPVGADPLRGRVPHVKLPQARRE
jgi:hypothetical protein